MLHMSLELRVLKARRQNQSANKLDYNVGKTKNCNIHLGQRI
jgi:hypothetical protein